MFSFLKRRGKDEGDKNPTESGIIMDKEKENIKSAIEGERSINASMPLLSESVGTSEGGNRGNEDNKNIGERENVMAEPFPASHAEASQPGASSQISPSPSDQLLRSTTGGGNDNAAKTTSDVENKINREIRDIDSLFSPSSSAIQSSSSSPSAKDVKDNERVEDKSLSRNTSRGFPLFISMKKYTEMIEEINTIKISLKTMEDVTRELNKLREKDNKVLDMTLNELEEINTRIKQISKSFKV